ncbi:MAG: hypothetical protein ACJAYI_002296 [Myxococcota bacterium]|jgi:hypothetical protein
MTDLKRNVDIPGFAKTADLFILADAGLTLEPKLLEANR